MTTRIARPRRAAGALSMHRKSAVDDTVPGARGWSTLQEAERCRVLARHVARVAAQDPTVRALRELLFGSPTGIVPRDQAIALLESPATQYLEPAFFKTHDLDFATHIAKMRKRKDVPAGHQHVREVRLLVRRSGRWVAAKRRVVISDAQGVHRPRQLQLPSRQGGPGFALAHPGTWLGLIADRCENFAGDLVWSVEAAIWFTFTGEAPRVEPVRAGYRVARDPEGESVRVEAVLHVQPFISMDTLARAMTAVRAKLGRRLRLGPPLAARTLEVFDFVEEQRVQGGEKWTSVPWTRLMRRWDNDASVQSNGWGYGDDRRNFRRDYLRARRFLIGEFVSPEDQ